MSEWKEVELGDCIDFLNGYAFKSSLFTEDSNDIVLVKGENLSKGFIEWSKSKYWDKNDKEKYAKFILKEDDVLLAMDRPWVGGGIKYAIIKKGDPLAFLVQRVGCIRANQIAKQHFIKYVIASEDFALYLKNIMGGVAVPHISPSQIKSFKFLLPSIPTQKRIASILSAYDDLIENNLKRIKLLEELAQRTYEEWFVKFKINEEHLDVGENGLPDGWEIKPLNSIVEIISGFAFKSNDYVENGKFKIVTIKNVQDGYFITNTTDSLIEVPQKVKEFQKLRTGDFIISLTGNVGRTCIVHGENYLLNQRVAKIIVKKEIYKSFIYSFLRSKSTLINLENLSNGAAQQNLSPVKMSNMNIVLPSEEIINSYALKFNNTIKLICNLNLQITSLKESRNILLPRLMSGKIGVGEVLRQAQDDILDMVAEPIEKYGK